MPQANQFSKQKRRSKALPVLGAAGLSLSLAGTASAVPGGPALNLPTSGNGDGNQVFLGEEEISDVSLATFYVFDRETDGHHLAYNLSAMAAADVTAAAVTAVAEVEAATVVEDAITAAGATAVEAAITGAEAAVASALGLDLAVAAAAEVVAEAEVIGAG